MENSRIKAGDVVKCFWNVTMVRVYDIKDDDQFMVVVGRKIQAGIESGPVLEFLLEDCVKIG